MKGRSTTRLRSILAPLAGLAIVTLCGAAGSQTPPLTATMTCDRTTGPGRVRCSVEARATGGQSIAWADVVLVELPDFAAALKGRIGPSDVTAHDAASEQWAFGLVARKAGEGTLKARVRAVVCEHAAEHDAGPPRCAPVTLEVRTVVHVG